MYQFGSLFSLSYQGLPIEYHPVTGLVCLTDLWRAQCSPASQRPLAWVRLEATQKLLKQLARQTGANPLWSERQHPGQKPEKLIVAIPGILETLKEDSDLRSYATPDLMVVYARYLALECYEWALANLSQETALADQWYLQQSQADQKQQRKAFTRRAVIAAGWSMPVVYTLALNQRAAAQVSAGRRNGTTTNTTTSPANSTTTVPNRTTTVPNSTTTLPNNTTTLPNSTTTLPNSTTTLPNSTTTLPNSTTTLPNSTTTLPSTTTTLPSTTTTLPSTTTTLPSTTTTLPSTTTTP